MTDPSSTRRKFNWANLLIGSGLAAMFAAAGAVFVEYAREKHDTCDIAAKFLEDETPSPILDQQSKLRLASAAEANFERCMKD